MKLAFIKYFMAATIVVISIFFSTRLTRIDTSSLLIVRASVQAAGVENAPSDLSQKELERRIDITKDTFQAVLELNPHSGWGHYLYAKFLFNHLLFQKAVDEYQFSLRYFDSMDIYKELGITYYYTKDYQKALDNMNIFQSLINTDNQSYKIKGNCLYELERYRAAIDAYRISVEMHDDFNVWNYIGVCHSHLGEFEQALEPFEEAVRMNPNESAIYKNLAALYGYRLKPENRDYLKAIDSYQRHLLLAPHDPENTKIFRRLKFLAARDRAVKKERLRNKNTK